MTPFFILVVCWITFWLAGWLGASWFATAPQAGRAALLVTFVFTGLTHFTAMQQDYQTMIPPPFPRHIGLIHLTGFLEVVGGVGLVIPRVRRAAAVGLMLLLLGLFPANIYAAVNDIPFRGSSPTPLWLRAPIQLVLLLSVWWVGFRARANDVESELAADSNRK